VRFGLAGIKGVGAQAVKSVIAAREENEATDDFFTFISYLDLRTVTRAVLEQLIRSGAMDSLTGTRAEKLGNLDHALEYGKEKQRDKLSGQARLFDALAQEDATIAASFEAVEPIDNMTLLTLEKEAAGFYLSGHPLDDIWPELERKITHTSDEIAELTVNQQGVVCGGLISGMKVLVDRNGNSYARMELEDREGTLKVTCWNRSFKNAREDLENETVVVLKGRVEVEAVRQEREVAADPDFTEEVAPIGEESVSYSHTLFLDKVWPLKRAPRKSAARKKAREQALSQVKTTSAATEEVPATNPSTDRPTLQQSGKTAAADRNGGNGQHPRRDLPDEAYQVLTRRLENYRGRSQLFELKVELRNGAGKPVRLLFKGENEEFLVELPDGYSPPVNLDDNL